VNAGWRASAATCSSAGAALASTSSLDVTGAALGSSLFSFKAWGLFLERQLAFMTKKFNHRKEPRKQSCNAILLKLHSICAVLASIIVTILLVHLNSGDAFQDLHHMKTRIQVLPEIIKLH
jgi:hypothetical protein